MPLIIRLHQVSCLIEVCKEMSQLQITTQVLISQLILSIRQGQ